MDFYCVFCGVICPTYCYPTHKEDFACHNVQCSGHAPVTTPLSSPQNPHLNGGGQIQGQELSKISNGVVGDHNQITATQPAAPPPPPHIQYFLHGIKSPREQSSHLGAYKGSKSHEYHKGRWRMSQVGPVRTQSAAQVLKNQPSMSKIKKGLYVGNLACIKTEGFLETMGITAVVSVLTRPRGADPTHPLNKAIALEDQLFVKAYDHPSQDIIQHFPGACEFIDKRLSPGANLQEPDETDDYYSPDEQPRPFTSHVNNNNNSNESGQPRKRHRVLIHCHAGISRSVTIAAAYLMQKKRQNFQETMQLIKRGRPIADPNEGFREQLQLWWNVRFQLFSIPEFCVPCEEYLEFRRRLVLQGKG